MLPASSLLDFHFSRFRHAVSFSLLSLSSFSFTPYVCFIILRCQEFASFNIDILYLFSRFLIYLFILEYILIAI